MRGLTLNEKITIKGILSNRGVPDCYIVRLNMSTALFIWSQNFRRSIADYAGVQIKYKNWLQRRRDRMRREAWTKLK